MCRLMNAALILVLVGAISAVAPAQIPSERAKAARDKHARWMEDRLEILGDRPLSRLVLPAAHDAGMYESGLLKSLAQTQDLDIYRQLCRGIRYFDLRPRWYDGKLFIHHGPVTGPEIGKVLEAVRRFLAEGHRELIILKLSHYDGFHDRAYKELVKHIKASLDPWLYKSLLRGKRLADITLAEYVRQTGRVLVVCDGDYPREHRSQGIWVFRDWDSGHPEQGELRVFDQYAHTTLYSVMKHDQFDKFNRYDAKCKVRPDVPCDLFLLSWTLTPTTNVRAYAAEANRNLEAAIRELEVPNRFGHVVNLLYADYIGSANVTEVAIQQNEQLSGGVARGKKE
jgi:hypothetical protein